jgi:leader peptidase (prepilin peptidase)/N-methyltransferase
VVSGEIVGGLIDPSLSSLTALPVWGLALVLGASVGSFLNVVVYRLPAGLSLVSPPSRCPRCFHPLSWFENVPVLGWLGLRGRCRHCRAAIAVRYPLVEAAMAISFLVILGRFGATGKTVGYWVFSAFLLALALIDADTKTLPNRLTQPLLVLGILFQGLTAGGPGLAAAVLGAVVGLWSFDAIALIGSWAFGRTAMGAGDGKLAAAIGAWLGWPLLLLAVFLACLFGALWGLGTAYGGRRDRRQTLPFGPFLAIGSAIALLGGSALIAFYLDLSGLGAVLAPP